MQPEPRERSPSSPSYSIRSPPRTTIHPFSHEVVNAVVPATEEAVAPDNDDTPVSHEPVNAVVPAAEEAGIAPPVTEPDVFEFDESTDSEVVHAEPAAEDGLQQLHGEPMLEFSDEETIEATVEGDGGFATARPMAPGTVLGKVELIRREGGDRRQLSSLGRLLSFF